MKTLCENKNYRKLDNIYLGKCYITVHALERFKEYLCKQNTELINRNDEYFVIEFKHAFSAAKHGKIKNYHNVIRLMNNNYKESCYLFNHSYGIRFVVIIENNRIVTCEPICNYTK
ncbi:MAG TPA: hypothetical protein DC057_10170 [Spirochaetia bacterium]|nr:hypothetical protein [Spirochaetia bacterium]